MLKFRKSNTMDLVDYLEYNDVIQSVSRRDVYNMQEREKEKGIFGNVFVPVTINGEPGIVEYLNNGTCFFKDGEELSDYILDDIELYSYISYWMQSGERVTYDWTDDVEFSDDDDALDWEADFDDEAIAKAFKLNGGAANSPWAGLEAIYRIEE
jgi:hypothetical protein